MISNVSDILARSDQASGRMNASAAPMGAAQSTSQKHKEDAATQKDSSLGQSARVTISAEAMQKLGLMKESQSMGSSQAESNETGLSASELKELSSMKTRDREVRAHERAHVAAGGGLVRKGASFQYELGPDGVRYAVSGEVSIDTSPVDEDPAATIQKMQKVKRAALAPAEPSSQDRSVASAASQQESAARMELVRQKAE